MRRVPGERELVVGVTRRWRAEYLTGDKWYSPESEAKYAKLSALDRTTASAADVAAIIGNTTWCEPEACSECGDRCWKSVRVAEDSDGCTVLCPGCLHVALSIAGESP